MGLKTKLSTAINGFPSTNLIPQLGEQRAAAVAMVLLGQEPTQLQLLIMQRAFDEKDHWSGQLGFPGGRREAKDNDLLQTAQRETFEEIGLQLSPPDFLGHLNDLQGRRGKQMMDFFIRPNVFHLDTWNSQLNLDAKEVQDVFWVSLSELKDPANATTIDWQKDNLKAQLPGIKVSKNRVLWGLSYLMFQDLMKRIVSITG